jgi:2-methylcitrate dehydratase PrpD
MTIAETLGEFLAGVSYAELPALTHTHAKMLIASTLASAACGTQIASAGIVRALERERGGRADACVWFDSGTALPLVGAARVNAMMSDAAASDDSDLRNIVHAGTPTIAAAFALAGRTGASGAEILSAIVVGYEAAGRIASAVNLGHGKRGFHGCVGAIFGAAAAAAHLLKLTPLQMAHTLALSATSIGGLAAAAASSVAREYHAGHATMLGMEAALAAGRGYTSELGIFEIEHGFCAVYGARDIHEITAGLGADWDIVTDMAIKLVPGGHPHHALAEAGANASRLGKINPDDVAEISVSRPGLTQLSGPLHPADLIDMAHSPAYFTAAGVADGRFGWEHATLEKIKNPTIHALIDKVKVGPQPTHKPEAYRHGASVAITTYAGETFSSTVLVPKGAACLGIDWCDVDEKYRTLIPQAQVNATALETSLGCIHEFEQCAQVESLLQHLR